MNRPIAPGDGCVFRFRLAHLHVGFLYLKLPLQDLAMKLLKTVVTAVALCAAFVAQARTLDEVKKDGKIIVATEGQFAPFNYFKGHPADGLRSRSGGAGRQEDGPEAGVEDPGL